MQNGLPYIFNFYAWAQAYNITILYICPEYLILQLPTFMYTYQTMSTSILFFKECNAF